MKNLKGAFLDSALKKIALDMIAVQETGLAIDVNDTLRNLNKKHKLVPTEEFENLTNDVHLSIAYERGRKLKSMSTAGYCRYRAEPHVETAMETMNRLGALFHVPEVKTS
ncbi:hypothetical protein [Pseudomonas aeruginosa]|uniref:hypothetical protein n=1 Tax=Pseudomonas aeruginosa TaxID=287 RepID=UPI0013C504EB|nr:hypothetical protein [Pseudomonas aeruginosa]HCT7102237.1 hypothetical protein [Pseudomonas aeruginosa]HEN8507927.1 hypothetical protein [Pseudomonas aeruginosa]HEN8756350.1 hypothetical protein [Pseudomonas aeruginosa]HEN8806121.1 hypothetical protein [Pseudomonas aeruginosa]